MKLAILLFCTITVLLVGGLAYIAFTDVPVDTKTVSKTIDNDRFFNAN